MKLRIEGPPSRSCHNMSQEIYIPNRRGMVDHISGHVPISLRGQKLTLEFEVYYTRDGHQPGWPHKGHHHAQFCRPA